jgi:hypothetical protein
MTRTCPAKQRPQTGRAKRPVRGLGTAGIVQHRIAALDAEIVRLTQLRNQLAARIVPAQRAELAS